GPPCLQANPGRLATRWPDRLAARPVGVGAPAARSFASGERFMTRLTIVSGDGHASPPIRELRNYLESRYHAEFDEFCDTEGKAYAQLFSGPSKPSAEGIKVFDTDGRFAA